MPRDDHAVQLIKFEQALVAKTKTKHYYSVHNIAQGCVSACKHQCMMAITTMWTESSWAFPESYTADDKWILRSSDGGQWEDKSLTPPPR